MFRFLFYTILGCLFLGSCTSKTVDKTDTARNDSIKKYLDLAGDGNISYEKSIKYNDKAYAMIDLSKNDTLTRFYLYNVSYYHYIFSNSNKHKLTAQKLMNLSLKANDSLNIGRANKILGLYYMLASDNEKAIEYFFKAKRIFKLIKRNDYVIKVMHNIAQTQYYACDFLGSNKTSVEMILLSEKVNFKKVNPDAFLNIGNNLCSLKNYNEAINYYIKGRSRGQSALFNNLANCYIEMGKYDIALKYVNRNVNNKKLLFSNPTGYSSALSLKSLIKLKCNNYSNIENDFFLAEEYFKKYKSEYGRNYNQIYLSMYYDKVKDSKKAVKAARNALYLSKSYNNPEDILNSLKQLIKVDKRNSTIYAQEYISVNDKRLIAERKFRDKFARIAYETDEINQEKEKAISQKWIVVGISGFTILIIVLLLIITRQRTKQRELRLLQSQQKANEEIYDLMLSQKSIEEEARQKEKKRIALELHDGVMNKLASTRLNLDVLHHKRDKQTIEECLGHIEEIYHIEQEIRNISHDLSHDIFKSTNSFKDLIEDFLNTQNKTYLTHFKLEMEEAIQWETISGSIKMNLFRIIQEASHNINKFAKAKNAVVTFVTDAENLCLSITDDGQGFDPEINNDGIGLNNIRQRVEMLNGKFVIQSIKNKYTSLNIAIPII